MMSDLPPAPGWWLASDGKWYSPEQSPSPLPQATAPEPAYVPAGVGPPPNVPGYGPPPTPFTYGPPPLQSGYGPPPAPPGYGYTYGYPASLPPTFPDPASSKTNGLAVAAMVCSFFFWIYGIGAVLGIVFGFVSRSQIKQSGGAQSGKGMATTGIVIGLVSLVIILPAIAIPTFLGVRTAESHRATEAIPVQHLPATPIALGVVEQGTPANPIPWKSQGIPGAALTVVPGGVDMTIARKGGSEWALEPVENMYASIELTANVGIVAGSRSNGSGLGCTTQDMKDQVAFYVYSSGYWQLDASNSKADVLIDSGITPAVRPGANALTIACHNNGNGPGTMEVSFAINGTPVANDIVALPDLGWLPTITLCSCRGPDTGSFVDAQYYASPDY